METIDVGTVTASTIIAAWSIIQAIGLEYLWFVKDWFDKLDAGRKKTVNGAGIFTVTAIVYGLSLADVINGFSADVGGAFAALVVLFTALGINQGVHMGTKRTS